jgi:hypothetical protein
MLWHTLLVFLAPLYVLLGRLLRDDRDRQILILRHELHILRRLVGKRPALTRAERLALVLASLGLAKRRLREAVLIVRPDTLVRWHREIVRRHWTFQSRHHPGRPPVTQEAERLVLRIARENARMGYTKIAGEMRKLGFGGFGRSTVRRILKQHGLAPAPQRGGGSLSWTAFLTHYRDFIWATDFFTVTTATLRTYYVLLALEVGSRRIRFWNVTQSPDGEWVRQQFRNLCPDSEQRPRFLLRDRDGKFTRQADTVLAAEGVDVLRLPARSPHLNAHMERCIRTLREECLDRIIILNEAHLRWVLATFVVYYLTRRPAPVAAPAGAAASSALSTRWPGPPPPGSGRPDERLLLPASMIVSACTSLGCRVRPHVPCPPPLRGRRQGTLAATTAVHCGLTRPPAASPRRQTASGLSPKSTRSYCTPGCENAVENHTSTHKVSEPYRWRGTSAG